MIIIRKDKGVMQRNKVHEELCLISQIESKRFDEASKDEFWIQAMEEVEKIENNNTWELVPRPKDKNIIGTKWVFRNKMNEKGEIAITRDRLV